MKSEDLEKLRVRIRSYAASKQGGQAAEDITQEVLVVLAEKEKALGSPLKFNDAMGFAVETLKYKCLEHGRRARKDSREIPVDDFSTHPGFVVDADQYVTLEQKQEQKQLLERLKKGIRRLPERCQKLIKFDLERLDTKTISVQLNISVGNVWTTRSRCYEKLKQIVTLEGDTT